MDVTAAVYGSGMPYLGMGACGLEPAALPRQLVGRFEFAEVLEPNGSSGSLEAWIGASIPEHNVPQISEIEELHRDHRGWPETRAARMLAGVAVEVAAHRDHVHGGVWRHNVEFAAAAEDAFSRPMGRAHRLDIVGVAVPVVCGNNCCGPEQGSTGA